MPENNKKNTPLSREEVQKVAQLAMLDLTEEELKTYTPQLVSSLQLADQFESFDLDNLQPVAHPHELTNIFRQDIVEEADIRTAALNEAPETENNQFKVPPALGEEL